jgi:N-acetylmuramoyl-L-alanine amidase
MSWALHTAARTLWQEARGEPLIDQQAVAHVIWNRVRSGRWGHTLASVCLWHDQFSGWRSIDPNFQAACGLADDDAALKDLMAIIAEAQYATDPTGGATHYYAPHGVVQTPTWVHGATPCGQFGSQLFFKDVK